MPVRDDVPSSFKRPGGDLIHRELAWKSQNCPQIEKIGVTTGKNGLPIERNAFMVCQNGNMNGKNDFSNVIERVLEDRIGVNEIRNGIAPGKNGIA